MASRSGYGVVQHDAGAGGEVTGWAPVNPNSMRFASFVSPRTNQTITGLCVELSGEHRESWINKAGRWERMDGWMKQAYLKRLDEESGSSEDASGLPEVTGTVDSL